ncbi:MULTISPECIES: hypothetical protein [unclassified Nocardia]|uniref:hypothetical protein n=1 Tax=unclassified Nocardia TaxID=2637762 RepID=UPI00278BE297|nr:MULTISPECIES: hypothetical protein [unclassified Nocardia]
MDYWVYRSRPVGHRDGAGGFVFDHEPEDALIGAEGMYLVSEDFAEQLDDFGYTTIAVPLSVSALSEMTTPPPYRALEVTGRTPGIDDAALTANGELIVSGAFLGWALPYGLDINADLPEWNG